MNNEPVRPVLVVAGDPVSGFEFYGPLLPNTPQIEDLTNRVLRGADWWYVEITPMPTDGSDNDRDGDEPAITITRNQLNALAGYTLTDKQVERLVMAWPNSSIPEAFGTIAASLREGHGD